MKSRIKYNHKGFTLIETLFAVLIFSASLISLMAIAGKGIAATNTAREQITAHYLAQEGIEVVRNIRDNDLINTEWSAGFDGCTKTSPCTVAYHETLGKVPQLDLCASNLSEGCVVNESQGAFIDNGNPSVYYRKIYAVPLGTQDVLTAEYDEYQIVSKITWKSKEISRSVTMTTLLKNWQ